MEARGEGYHGLEKDGIVTTDTGPWRLKCGDCNMVFGHPSLLQKHKARFCVGSQLGDPDSLMLRRGLRETETLPHRSPDPALPVPEEEETPRHDASKDQRVRQLAELHGKQMEFLRNKNSELEQQREEIRRQLEALGRRQPVKEDNMSEELLKELRAEEEKSRRLLEELRKQLADARRPVNIISAEKSEPASRPVTFPVAYGGGSLVAEILAVKHAYIQNGSNNPEILAQLDQMLAEAQALEDSLKNMPPSQPKEKDDSQLISVEMENNRLLEQLIQIQEQKILNKRRGNREDELERELRRMRRDHIRKMYDLQLQLERMRQDSNLDRLMLEIYLQNQSKVALPPHPPTKLILKQRPPPPAPAPQVTQRTETYEENVPYDDDSGTGRYHTYGHTWVHTQHRQDVEEDPDFDLDL